MTGVTGMMAAGAFSSARRSSVTVTLSTNITNYLIDPASASANGPYVAGQTDVTLVVNSGVYVYSSTYLTAGLAVGAFASGDTVSIINNGYIIGKGGDGGSSGNGQDGSPAITLGYPVTITNNSYIAGGGGGGGSAVNSGGTRMGGGGGAGGGVGGTGTSGTPGAAGGPGSAGTDGTGTNSASGGGGGRILPGIGGLSVSVVVPPNVTGSQILPGKGGGSGGSGAAGAANTGTPVARGAASGFGGNANVAGGGASLLNNGGTAGGGGGGWGATGGNGNVGVGTSYIGGAGGKAVNLNGHTVTWLTTGTVYGAVS